MGAVAKCIKVANTLSRGGGIIAFHEVAGNYESTQVKLFWDSVNTDYSHCEFTVRSDGLYGIGDIFKKQGADGLPRSYPWQPTLGSNGDAAIQVQDLDI